MNDTVSFLASLAAVLTFLGIIFSHFVLSPLQLAIKELQETAKDIRKDIRDAGERRHELELKVIEIDQRAKSAHHRLDDHINKEG